MEDPTSLSVIGRTGVTVKPGTEHLDHPSGLLATLDGQTFDQFFRAHYETIGGVPMPLDSTLSLPRMSLRKP